MRLPISLGGTRGTVTPVTAKRKLDGDELLGAQLPRRPKIEHDSEEEYEEEEEESAEEKKKKPEEKPAEAVLASTSLPAEIMDSQDEEEDEEWLEAVDLQSTEPDTQQEEDDTEQLLRSMVEGDV